MLDPQAMSVTLTDHGIASWHCCTDHNSTHSTEGIDTILNYSCAMDGGNANG